jgi:hypothetical protein
VAAFAISCFDAGHTASFMTDRCLGGTSVAFHSAVCGGVAFLTQIVRVAPKAICAVAVTIASALPVDTDRSQTAAHRAGLSAMLWVIVGALLTFPFIAPKSLPTLFVFGTPALAVDTDRMATLRAVAALQPAVRVRIARHAASVVAPIAFWTGGLRALIRGRIGLDSGVHSGRAGWRARCPQQTGHPDTQGQDGGDGKRPSWSRFCSAPLKKAKTMVGFHFGLPGRK